VTGGIFSARDHRGDLELGADTVVVGSGAGGAVIATELALAGQDVIVLEEGPHVSAEQHGAMRPSESLRHVWRDGGTTIAWGVGDTPAINVTMGKVVGGSSMVTGGVCFRIPGHILDEWQKDLGLTELTERALEPHVERVERAMHVEEVPVAMRSRSTELFAIGAAKRGIQLESMRRNTRGCTGCGRCNFGCPESAKMSVDLSYLPRATRSGARVWSHCLVDRVETRGSRAIGVTGRILNRPGGKKGDVLRVHAKRVVLAAGAWHTPLILMKSRIGSRENVGKRLTLHPGFRVLARFDERVAGWQGALQSAWTDAFEHKRISLMGLFVPVGVLGATMPGIGVEHTDKAHQIGNLAMFGGIIHDAGGGTIHRAIGREPFVTYRMQKTDRALVPILLRTIADIFFAAGAREVFLPVLGLRGLDADALARADLDGVPARRIECASQHPLGSCQMGVDPRRSVVDPDGRVWDVDSLYIADGSIVPTSLGVNPQVAIMTLATRIASRMIEPAVN
jgi:choline dehydrogenase-like flavoprotein